MYVKPGSRAEVSYVWGKATRGFLGGLTKLRTLTLFVDNPLVVSIGHFPAFYVVLVPLEYTSPFYLRHSFFVREIHRVTFSRDRVHWDIICILTTNSTNTK